MSNNEDIEQTNHYGELIDCMREGLLITVNNFAGASAPGSDQLKVTDSRGRSRFLETQEGEVWRLGPNYKGDIVLEDYDDDRERGREYSVETIEVIGVDG